MNGVLVLFCDVIVEVEVVNDVVIKVFGLYVEVMVLFYIGDSVVWIIVGVVFEVVIELGGIY